MDALKFLTQDGNILPLWKFSKFQLDVQIKNYVAPKNPSNYGIL